MILLPALGSNELAGQTYNFIGQDFDLWSDAASWDLGSVPNNTNATVIVNTHTVGGISQHDTVRYDLTSGQLRNLIIGDTQTGKFIMNPGTGLNAEYSILGRNNGSSGIATVSGAGTTWVNSSFINIGNFGYGELEIANG